MQYLIAEPGHIQQLGDSSLCISSFRLTYVTDCGLAPYISYLESFLPTVGTAVPERGGNAFIPTEGEQYEVGVKHQPFDKTLLTAAVFQIKQKNVLTGDVDYPQYESQSGDVRSRGIEVEHRPVRRGGRGDLHRLVLRQGNLRQPGQPQRGPGTGFGHGVGGLPLQPSHPRRPHLGVGARYTEYKPGDAANSFHTPVYVVYDTTVSDDFSHFSPSMDGLQARLNVQSLFDREYVSDCNSAFGCHYGQECVALVEMTYDW